MIDFIDRLPSNWLVGGDSLNRRLASVGIPAPHFPCVDGGVTRRFFEVLSRWLEAWRMQRRRKLLSKGPKVSEDLGWRDLTLKLCLGVWSRGVMVQL